MKCSTHPWYKGIYHHRTHCETCDIIYHRNHGTMTTPIPQLDEPKEVHTLWSKIKRAMGL